MIRARQIRSTYWVSELHPDGERVRSRLDRIMTTHVAQTMAGMFRSGPQDESVWKIRRLRADATVDLDLDDSAVARVWAGSIVTSLQDALEDADPEVLRFESADHLLAAYLADAAAGHTGQWYYREFEGLEMLPVSAKIRTALMNYGNGGGALRLLTPSARAAVARNLTEHDARALLQWVEAKHGRAPGNALLLELLDTWMETGQPLPEAGGEFRWALRFVAETGARRRSLALSDVARVAPALARLISVAMRLSETARVQLVEQVLRGNLVWLMEHHGTETAERLQVLCELETGPWVGSMERAASVGEEGVERRSTLFGGAFLLLPLVAESGCTELVQDAGLFRLWLLARCLGYARAETVWRDPLLRELCGAGEDEEGWAAGLPEDECRRVCEMMRDSLARGNADLPKTAEDLAYLEAPEALRSTPENEQAAGEMATLLLRNFAWRLPGFSASSFGHLFANFLDFAASVEEQEGQRLVRVAYPPLGLVLNLTGLSRQSYTLPWLDARRFKLYPEA